MNRLAPLMTSSSQDYETPSYIYNALDSMYGFTLDPCASHENHKTARYYTEEDDGLSYSWSNEVVFMNPPYKHIGMWMYKAYNEVFKSKTPAACVVCLIPARTDTKWWWNFAKPGSILFIKGRIRFNEKTAKSGAPFPSAVVTLTNAPMNYKFGYWQITQSGKNSLEIIC